MLRRFAVPVAILAALLLLIHAILSFTKMRWVTGLAEIGATAVILGQWWILRSYQAPLGIHTAGSPGTRS